MSNEEPKKTDGIGQNQRTLPNKASVYNEFILWSAMPPMEQARLGIETQEAFCEYYKISRDTCWHWKQRPDFQSRRMAILKIWAKDRTPGVVQGIYRAAVKGNSDSQRIWLKYFEGWVEETKIDHTQKVEITTNDIRFIIEGMPEKEKEQCYGYLREILDISQSLREAGRLQDGTASYEADEAIIRDQADNDAQDIPDAEASQIPTRHPSSLCTDMERFVFQDNYKGSARWWQKRTARDSWI
jgi:hypothetical protein